MKTKSSMSKNYCVGSCKYEAVKINITGRHFG